MKTGYSKIIIVLDRSGSMQSVRSSTIEGFNKFLSQQKEIEGKCDVSLYQFNTTFETIYKNRDIQEVPNLTEKTFVPNGFTALLDAIGNTINLLGNDLRNTAEKNRPEKVFFVIQTDGEENSSKEFTRDKIFEMIKHQTDKYNWKFVFLGANQDAIQVGMSYGIAAGASLTYSSTPVGTSHAYNTMNTFISGARCAAIADFQNYSFTQADRDLQKS